MWDTPPLFYRCWASHQSGKVRPRADQQGSASQYTDRHHLRGGLFNTLGLSCSEMWQTTPSVSYPPLAEIWLIDLGPHGLSGMVLSKGQSEDAASSVAAKVALVSSRRQSCYSSAPVRGVLAVYHVMMEGGMSIWNPSPDAPSISSSVHRCVQDRLKVLPQDLTAAGVWTEEELDLHINIFKRKAV